MGRLTAAGGDTGRLLGISEVTGQQTTTQTGASGEAFSPACSVTVTAPASGRVSLIATCEYASNGTAASDSRLIPLQDGVSLGRSRFFRSQSANQAGEIELRRAVSGLTPGQSYTFSLNKGCSAGTTTYLSFGYALLFEVREG